MRDPTRGGIASSLNEIAKFSDVGIGLQDNKIPVPKTVRVACELLRLDPFYVANEGKLLAIAPKENADELIEAMRKNEFGEKATIIGEVAEENAGMIVAKTGIGGTRVVDMQLGEQLPRIC